MVQIENNIATYYGIAGRNGRIEMMKVRRVMACAEFPTGRELSSEWTGETWPDTKKGLRDAANEVTRRNCR